LQTIKAVYMKVADKHVVLYNTRKRQSPNIEVISGNKTYFRFEQALHGPKW